MKIRYIGREDAHVSGLPAFAPGEVRDVDAETAETLLRNPHFVRLSDKGSRGEPADTKGD